MREAGFTDPQAEAVVASMQEAAEGAAFATKADLDSVRGELKAEIAALRSELREPNCASKQRYGKPSCASRPR